MCSAFKLSNFLFAYYFTIMVRSQQIPISNSPCPDTFQYKMDSNGDIYGAIGVYSLDDNIIRLNVELSVGNHVDSYNGEIRLAYSRNRVVDDVFHRRPVRYKVIFPRWENTPPRITKILVNGQLVCSGPPHSIGGGVPVLTTIDLQHTLTIRVTPLQSSNPFLGNDDDDEKPTPPIKNPFFTNLPTSTTTSERTISSNSIPTNEFVFSKNPFLSGNSPPQDTMRNTSSIPTFPSRDFPERPLQTTTTPPFRINPQLPFSDICGLPVLTNLLVVNGDSVPRGAFPWLAAMFSVTNTGLEYKCSGSLISQKHIVTAAHCVEEGRRRIRPDRLLFVLGKLNIQRWTLLDGEKMLEADTITVHPDYVPMTSDADIAIVVLSEVIQFSKYIRPICLWSESDDLEAVVGQRGKVIGWGRDETGNLMTAEPKQTTIPIVSQEQCLWSAETFKFITSNRTFCAGSRNGSGPCNGDSGSGFIMKRHGRWTLRGVVSISTYDPNRMGCDLSNYVVFTDASKFKTWLLSFII